MPTGSDIPDMWRETGDTHRSRTGNFPTRKTTHFTGVRREKGAFMIVWVYPLEYGGVNPHDKWPT